VGLSTKGEMVGERDEPERASYDARKTNFALYSSRLVQQDSKLAHLVSREFRTRDEPG
jgi:hypothetical protein